MFYDSAAQIFPALLAVLGGGGEDRGGLKSGRARLQLLLIHLAEAWPLDQLRVYKQPKEFSKQTITYCR